MRTFPTRNVMGWSEAAGQQARQLIENQLDMKDGKA